MSDLIRLMRPLRQQISNLIARGTIAAVDAARKMQSLQVRLLAGEIKDTIEHVEPYGFTSHPQAGAEAVALFLDGDRSHGVVLVVADRRYRLTSLEAGEVALYDDLGQKVHLTRDGMVIDGAGLPIVINNAPSVTVTSPVVTLQASTKVRIESAELESTGEIKDRCDSDGSTMEWIRTEIETINSTIGTMKTKFNAHRHTEYDVAGLTSTPNQTM